MINHIGWLALASLVVLGCQRETRQSSLGPQSSAEQIIEAQNKSLSKLDPYLVKKGQRVHKVDTQEVISSQGPAKFMSKEWVTEIMDVENHADVRLLTAHKSVVDKVWDKDFTYKFKNVYTLAQIKTLALLDQLNQNSYSLKSVVATLEAADTIEENEIEGVAFHNLKTTVVSLVPPQLVKEADNCKAIKDCRIKADLITYDVVFLLKGGDTQTHNVEWFISDEVPFFASFLKQCATTIIPVDKLRVLVKQCTEVVDFDHE